jgi:hypothetical protein
MDLPSRMRRRAASCFKYPLRDREENPSAQCHENHLLCLVRGSGIRSAGASRFLLFLFRPWLESPFQFPGLLNLGQTPKSDGFAFQKFDPWSDDRSRRNPMLQGCSRNLRHLGDLDCRVKVWTHDLNPIT